MPKKPPLDSFMKKPDEKESLEPSTPEEGESPVQFLRGKAGPEGKVGPKGDVGPQGPQGFRGTPGEDGANGTNGRDGKDGKNGARGERGFPGEKGEPGNDGKDGLDGKSGSPDTGKEIITKINSNKTEKIKASKIDGFDNIEGMVKNSARQMNSFMSTGSAQTLTVKNGSTLVGTQVTAINFTNATVTKVGDGREVNISVSGGSSPLTTKGDLYTYSTGDARLGVGGDGQVLVADSTQTTGLKWATVTGTGDVVGPGSATDNAIARFDGTTGKLIQNSVLTIDDTTGNVTGPSAGFSIIGGTGTTADLTLQTTSGVGAAGADMHFLVGNAGATEAMTILNNGNVGVNTTAPAVKLNVLSTDTTNGQFRVAYDASNYAPFTVTAGGTLQIFPTNNAVVMGSSTNVASSISIARNSIILGGLTTASGFFSVYGGTTVANHLTVTSSGSVGINTTGPDRKLDVLDTTAPQLRLTYTDSTVYTDLQTNSSGNLVLTPSGGTVDLGSSTLTLTGSLGATGTRVTKGWFTDLESTNIPTVGGTPILTSLANPQFTTIELGNASDTTLARVSAGVISVEGVTVATSSNTLTFTNKTIQGAAITGALTGTGAYIPVTLLNSGTSASGTTFWRGDGTWATPAGGGDMVLASVQTVTGAKTFNAGKLLDKGEIVFDVKAYGAAGDGTTDDTAAIQSAVDACNTAGGGVVWFPKGTYKLVTNPIKLYSGTTPTITSYSNITLLGAGSSTVGGSILTQTSTGVDCIKGLNDVANGAQSTNNTIKNLAVQWGTATLTNSGNGIYLAQQASGGPSYQQWTIENVTASNFQGSGKYGFNIESMITSSIIDCQAVTCANGFYLNGAVGGAYGSVSTSVTFLNCYANMATNGVNGYNSLDNTYISFIGCACDIAANSTGSAYLIDGSNTVTFTSCGFELNGTATLAAGFKITSSFQVAMYNGYGFQSKSTKDVWVTGSSTGVDIIGFQDNSTISGSTGLTVDAGSSVTELDNNYGGATARSINATAIDVILNDSAGNLTTKVGTFTTSVKLNGSTSGTTTVIATAIAGTTTLTLPAATDTLVGKATTDIFTNKTGTASSNTWFTLTTTGTSGAATYTGNTLNIPQYSGGTGITWTEVTGTSQSAAINNGYITNNAGLVTVTLPSTAAVGSIVEVAGKGAGLWKVAQNASGIIHYGNVDTTTGTGGSLAAVNRYDSVRLVCIVANNEWVVLSSQGNITYV